MKKGEGLYFDLVSSATFAEGGIYSRVLKKGPDFDYTMMCLASGTGIDTHTSTKNALVVVISGKGVFTLSGDEIEMRPGVAIPMPPDAKHSLRATEDLTILLVLHK